MIDPVAGYVFAIDKPLGWSSFHVVKKLRGALLARLRKVGIRKLKVGHAGTLDPLATGVMLLCCGKATRTIDTLQAGTKVYVAEIALGATTPSFDMETPVDATYPTEHITRELVEETLRKFVGDIEQIPPQYSACKIEGERAYELIRKGETPDLKPKILRIDEITLLDFSPKKITVRVVCSKGTYIRALARDIGVALNSGGHLTALRRERVGDYSLADCMQVDRAEEFIRSAPMQVHRDDGTPEEVPPLAPRHSDRPATDDGGPIKPWHLRPENQNFTQNNNLSATD